MPTLQGGWSAGGLHEVLGHGSAIAMTDGAQAGMPVKSTTCPGWTVAAPG